MEKKKFTSVSLPITLVEKIKKIIEGTGFVSVGSYVEYVMRELVVMHSKDKKNSKKILSEEDKEILTERLKALGYM